MAKFIMCECCDFLAVIPNKDSEEELCCPFCQKVKCDHGGKFVEITENEFQNAVDQL